MPGNWNDVLNPTDQAETYGYVTYHLRILMDKPLSELISIWFQSIYISFEVEINGVVLSRFGMISEQKEGHIRDTGAGIDEALQKRVFMRYK